MQSQTARLFVEHITNLDFSYINPQGIIAGESWAVDIEIEGQLNEDGMLMDFGDVKKSLKADIESLWDHKLVVPRQRSNLSIEGDTLKWTDDNQQNYCHSAPETGTFFMDQAEFNQSYLQEHLQNWLLTKWQSPQIQHIQLNFRSEQIPLGEFQYSHGLKHHKGACQRIAHGHRSKVLVYTKDGLDHDFTSALAKQLTMAYFLDEHNIKTENNTHICLSYIAPEGQFTLELPKTHVFRMKTETTIENIARFLLSYSRDNLSDSIEKIKVYEGWQKGAIATLNSL